MDFSSIPAALAPAGTVGPTQPVQHRPQPEAQGERPAPAEPPPAPPEERRAGDPTGARGRNLDIVV